MQHGHDGRTRAWARLLSCQGGPALHCSAASPPRHAHPQLPRGHAQPPHVCVQRHRLLQTRHRTCACGRRGGQHEITQAAAHVESALQEAGPPYRISCMQCHLTTPLCHSKARAGRAHCPSNSRERRNTATSRTPLVGLEVGLGRLHPRPRRVVLALQLQVHVCQLGERLARVVPCSPMDA